ncbi:hypothetical protein LQ948_14095 [Jiella sp. MQZ9-1]|uniref:Lipoprotein n=1 Tax=Jiella flava TaxID=2816857 RepID=A0A939FYA5_9HYPH|nr:hypothetical protein [Jiella flava]MBO0663765.1 hypothetical protein [Jiella flava]MCD2472338.1 hypothetical protein [Jiella flava]
MPVQMRLLVKMPIFLLATAALSACVDSNQQSSQSNAGGTGSATFASMIEDGGQWVASEKAPPEILKIGLNLEQILADKRSVSASRGTLARIRAWSNVINDLVGRNYDGDSQYNGGDSNYNGDDAQYNGRDPKYGGSDAQYNGGKSNYNGDNSNYNGGGSNYGNSAVNAYSGGDSVDNCNGAMGDNNCTPPPE